LVGQISGQCEGHLSCCHIYILPHLKAGAAKALQRSADL
jgi:hypothetical protein